MKTIIAVLVFLTPSLFAQDYEAKFEAQLKNANTAMVAYAATDCRSNQFNDTANKFIKEIEKMADLVNTMPDELDDMTRIRLTEEGYGFLVLERQFISKQNECVEKLNENKPKTNSEGD